MFNVWRSAAIPKTATFFSGLKHDSEAHTHHFLPVFYECRWWSKPSCQITTKIWAFSSFQCCSFKKNKNLLGSDTPPTWLPQQLIGLSRGGRALGQSCSEDTSSCPEGSGSRRSWVCWYCWWLVEIRVNSLTSWGEGRFVYPIILQGL